MLIKRTALLVNSLLLLLLRSIAAWTRKIRSKINKQLLPSTATPPCAVWLKIANARTALPPQAAKTTARKVAA